MFRRIHEYRAVLPVLSGLVFLAFCNNTIFWTFCPHLSAKSQHCHMAMSDMDESELPFEASTTAEADAQESCSHCMMHPQSGVNLPSALIVPNNSTSHDIVPAASSIVWASVASPLTFVDVHDHGPPGLNGSRYILNSSFRI